MRAVDTNVLVRFLVQDDEVQTQIASQLLIKAEDESSHYSSVMLLCWN